MMIPPSDLTLGPSPAAGAPTLMARLGTDDDAAVAGPLSAFDGAPQGGAVAPAFGQVLSGFLHQADESQHQAK